MQMNELEKRRLLDEHETLLREYLALEPSMHLHRAEAQELWHRLRRLRRHLGDDAPPVNERVWGMC